MEIILMILDYFNIDAHVEPDAPFGLYGSEEDGAIVEIYRKGSGNHVAHITLYESDVEDMPVLVDEMTFEVANPNEFYEIFSAEECA